MEIWSWSRSISSTYYRMEEVYAPHFMVNILDSYLNRVTIPFGVQNERHVPRNNMAGPYIPKPTSLNTPCPGGHPEEPRGPKQFIRAKRLRKPQNGEPRSDGYEIFMKESRKKAEKGEKGEKRKTREQERLDFLRHRRIENNKRKSQQSRDNIIDLCDDDEKTDKSGAVDEAEYDSSSSVEIVTKEYCDRHGNNIDSHIGISDDDFCINDKDYDEDDNAGKVVPIGCAIVAEQVVISNSSSNSGSSSGSSSKSSSSSSSGSRDTGNQDISSHNTVNKCSDAINTSASLENPLIVREQNKNSQFDRAQINDIFAESRRRREPTFQGQSVSGSNKSSSSSSSNSFSSRNSNCEGGLDGISVVRDKELLRTGGTYGRHSGSHSKIGPFSSDNTLLGVSSAEEGEVDGVIVGQNEVMASKSTDSYSYSASNHVTGSSSGSNGDENCGIDIELRCIGRRLSEQDRESEKTRKRELYVCDDHSEENVPPGLQARDPKRMRAIDTGGAGGVSRVGKMVGVSGMSGFKDRGGVNWGSDNPRESADEYLGDKCVAHSVNGDCTGSKKSGPFSGDDSLNSLRRHGGVDRSVHQHTPGSKVIDSYGDGVQPGDDSVLNNSSSHDSDIDNSSSSTYNSDNSSSSRSCMTDSMISISFSGDGFVKPPDLVVDLSLQDDIKPSTRTKKCNSVTKKSNILPSSHNKSAYDKFTPTGGADFSPLTTYFIDRTGVHMRKMEKEGGGC